MNGWPPLVCVGFLLVGSSASAAEPTVKQCIAANEDGQDLRRTGKLRNAADRFDLCSNASCPSPLREDCVARLKDTEGAIPTIVFAAKDSRGRAVRSVKVTMDGALLAGGGEETPLSVEPGEHTFELAANGYMPLSKRFAIQEGVKGREEIVLFESAKTVPTWNAGTQRTIAYVVGSVGIIGLGIGAVFGVSAKTTYDDAVSNCGSSTAGTRSCNAAGQAGGDRADRQAVISTVALVAGTALVAGGVVLFMTTPKDRGVSVAVSGAGFRLRGCW